MSGGRQVEQVMLRCAACGNETHIWRKMSRLKEPNHVKHMYCPHCRGTRPFKEVREWN